MPAVLMLHIMFQGKGKGKGKGKSSIKEETQADSVEEMFDVYRLRTLDVFAGCGGKHQSSLLGLILFENKFKNTNYQLIADLYLT